MYRALTRFADLQDGNRIYEAGDMFPRLGYSVTEERLAELAGSDNRSGKPLIIAVESPAEAREEHGSINTPPTRKTANKADSAPKTRRSKRVEK